MDGMLIMVHFSRTPGQSWNCKLVLSLTLVLLLLVAPSALAIKYRPTRPSAPKGNTTITGVRGGCDAKAKVDLAALAPIGHIGQTISTRPTIAWFIPDTTPRPLIFRLYRYSADQQWQLVGNAMQLPQSTPGIMQLTLPQELEVGPVYGWQVVVDCVPGYPSARLVAEAQIQVVNAPADLKAKLANARSALARAELYANAGLWYDALAETLSSSRSLQGQETQRSLLSSAIEVEQAMLRDLEKAQVNCMPNSGSKEAEICKQIKAIRQQIDSLTQIVTIK
jgi:Domain of Unknown Function (DUF928)